MKIPEGDLQYAILMTFFFFHTSLHESFSHVKKQLQQLWSADMVNIMFTPLFDICKNVSDLRKSSMSSTLGENPSSSLLIRSNFLQRAVEKTTTAVNRVISSKIPIHCSNSNLWQKFGSPEVAVVSLICSMYVNAINTLSQVKMDILSGLCYQDLVLPQLWQFLSNFGPKNGLQAFLDHLPPLFKEYAKGSNNSSTR